MPSVSAMQHLPLAMQASPTGGLPMRRMQKSDSTRSLGSQGAERVPRSRAGNSRLERAAQADNLKRARENKRSMRVEFIEPQPELARTAELPKSIAGADEFLLRWASEPMQRAIEHVFANSRILSTVRVVRVDQHASPGDVLLRPMAVFEVHDASAEAAYAAQRAKMQSSGAATSALASAVATEGVFDAAVDPGGVVGPLSSGAPLNESVLFHGLPANEALEVLYGGLYEHAHGGSLQRCFGPGMYFGGSVCEADRFAGDRFAGKQKGEPGEVLAGHLRLTEAELVDVRFMLVCRVLLGQPATTQETKLPGPFDRHVDAASGAPIFAPRTAGRKWAPPFSSLIADDELGNTAYVLKGGHAARCLPIALVAYRHVPVRTDELVPRELYGDSQWRYINSNVREYAQA